MWTETLCLIVACMATKKTKQAEARDSKVATPTLERLDAFRWAVLVSLVACRDALFEMIDGLLTVDPALPSLAYLSLSPTVSRGHDMLYRALNEGRVDRAAFRDALWSQPVPRVGGRIVLAVDGTGWPRPDANCSDRRTFWHKRNRSGGGGDDVPAWVYSFVVACESGASSWVCPLDVELIGPEDTEMSVAVRQLRRRTNRPTTTSRDTADLWQPMPSCPAAPALISLGELHVNASSWLA